MTGDEARLKLLEFACGKTVKGFRIRFKNESFWQRLLGFFMFWNPGYLIDFVSVFFRTVWWTTRKDYERNPWVTFKVLAHEWVHILDGGEHRGWFPFSYVSVQVWGVISIFALLSIWFGPWFLLFLVALLFFAPWPSPWRIKWETRGYAIGMAVNYWKHGAIKESTKDWIVEVLTGSVYYFPAWSKRRLCRRLDKAAEAIESGEVLKWNKAFPLILKIMLASDQEVIDAVETDHRIQ